MDLPNIVVSDTLPDDVVIVLPGPRIAVEVVDAVTGETRVEVETVDDYAHRCVVIRDAPA